MRYRGFPEYVTVAEKKAKAAKKLKELMKKRPDVKPVIIEGNAIVRTWWGKAWNRNVEQYADYSNRIGRGRSYVKHGAVLDLRIMPGEVQALVQGTAPKPYSVEIKITELKKDIWQGIICACEGMLDSLQALLTGAFPKETGELFTRKGNGLFPSPEEIKFSCSCPDWAYMCKHVAATLYGIGARLDEDPMLFFSLRKKAMGDLIRHTVSEQTARLISKSGTGGRIIEDADLSEVFGIEIADAAQAVLSARPEKKEKAPVRVRKKTGLKTEKKDKNKSVVKRKKTAARNVTAKKKAAAGKKKKAAKKSASI